eukprot:12531443-Ditylum_brightwellii.AAC.1
MAAGMGAPDNGPKLRSTAQVAVMMDVCEGRQASCRSSVGACTLERTRHVQAATATQIIVSVAIATCIGQGT